MIAVSVFVDGDPHESSTGFGFAILPRIGEEVLLKFGKESPALYRIVRVIHETAETTADYSPNVTMAVKPIR